MAATTRLSVNITNETAEALRSLAEKEKEWRKTVADIVRQTTDLLKSESLSIVSMVAIPAGSHPAARLGSQTRAGASWEPCSSAGFTRSASTMPGHQWTVSTLIREVLADPNLARRASSAACPWAGLQDLVDAEAAAVIGAGRYERTSERTNRRNGTRPKTVATTAEEVELAIPKLRTGSFFPSHTRRRVDKALYAVICQAWIEGVSTRKVDDPVKALGNESGISRSTVSRIHDGHRRGRARVPRPVAGSHLVPPPVRRRHLPGRESGAPGGLPGAGGGHRRVGRRPLGDPGHGPVRRHEEGFRVLFLDDPEGVVLVTSDARSSIRAAVKEILPEAAWQRFIAPLCPQHHLQTGIGPIQARGRPGLDHLRPDQSGDHRHPVRARHQLPEGLVTLQNCRYARRRPVGPDGLRHLPPREFGRRSGCSNTTERIKYRTRSVLLKQHEEWQYGEQRYLSQTLLLRLTDTLHADNGNRSQERHT